MAADALFTLADMATQVALNVGATDDFTMAKAKKWINRSILRFEEMGTWGWQKVYAQVLSTVALQEEYSVQNILKITSMYLSTPIQRRMTLLDERQFRRMYPNNTAVGTPYYYHTTGWSTATINTRKYALYPIPDTIYTVKYDGIRPITLLSNDTDDIRLITGMPSNLVDIVIEMATAVGFKEEQDVDSSAQMQECIMRLKGAYQEDHSEIDDRLVMVPMEADDLDRYFDPQLDPRFSE